MILIENLVVSNPTFSNVLFKVSSFMIKKNEVGFIKGESGRGKSTFFKILAKLYYFYEGSIWVNDIPIEKYQDKNYFALVQYVNQYYTLFPHMTAFEQLVHVLTAVKQYDIAFAKELVSSHLEKLSLFQHRNKKPAELSGGQRQRIAIIQKVILDPYYLLLDEPSASLDKENKEDLFEYLSNVRIKNTCLIIATHDNDLDSFFTDKKVLVL